MSTCRIAAPDVETPAGMVNEVPDIARRAPRKRRTVKKSVFGFKNREPIKTPPAFGGAGLARARVDTALHFFRRM